MNNLYAPNAIIPLYQYEILNIRDNTFNIDYHVQLRITEACDLQCEYCHWHSGKHYNYDDIIETVKALFDFFKSQKYTSIIFYYHGGEATRHPKILDILKYIKDKAKEYNIQARNELQTNLTLPNAKFKELVKYCDKIDISLHYKELIRRSYKKKEFDNNFNWLVDNNIIINSFDIMLENVDSINLQTFYNEINAYLNYKNIIHSEMIYGFYEYSSAHKMHEDYYKKYNKTEQSYLIDGITYNTNELFQRTLDCRGWKCNTGKKHIYVNGDGNVFVCAAPMSNYVKNNDSETPFTNLLSDKLAINKLSILTKSGTICKWASCAGDFYVNRKKD